MIQHVSDEVLSAHLDGALDRHDDRQVLDHLATCQECAHRLDLLGATARAVSGLPDEPLPAPLDLAFLKPQTATDPVLIPMPRRWRPPAWAAPVLAAAAILVVAVTLGPGLLPHGGASTVSSSAGESTSKYRADQGLAVVPSAPTGSVPGGTAAPVDGAVPAVNGQFATTDGPRATRSFPQSGGVVVELGGSQQALRTGQATGLSLAVHAGATDLQVQRSYITVGRANASQQVTAGSGEVIPAKQARSLAGTWVAGKIGSAPEAAGEYQVEGHVLLADGTDLRVSFILSVR
ncbi:MAG TPA: zf-HC2 domain-containing protein [Candidatus Dormibacteraeota bacterium]|nr:zf-HC2 domain-containing protein [Candidatus Dormibacteraeota bacterium]